MKLKALILAIAVYATSVNTDLSATAIVPLPAEMKETGTEVILPAEIGIYASSHELGKVAETYIKSLQSCSCCAGKTSAGNTSDTSLPEIFRTSRKDRGFISLYIDKGLSEEEYSLVIRNDGINITGGSDSGVWWGLQSLTQILIQARPTVHGKSSVPGLQIKDRPIFQYRGAMLDCCRHFFTADEVKRFIDILSLHKLNTFHWHLTDDQGWRIEIRKYPLLTEKGSIRKGTIEGHLFNSTGFDNTPYGGFYTQEEIRDIVKYASDRHISVIPEIEMPGHAMAALSAYPQFGCKGEGYEVWTTWGVSDEVFCMGKEETFDFLKGILEEVCALFPGDYIHIGGDEAPVTRWENCPDCQALMAKEGYGNERQLQGYLLHQIEPFLNSKGKKIIGWDEILDGGVTPTATVMSWRGTEGGKRAARQGNQAVMSPNSNFYLDYYQTNDPQSNGEPLGIGGYISLEKCWSFDPYEGLTEKESDFIKGIQANVWTEYMPSFSHVQHMILPRLAAVSEVAWSNNKNSYSGFLDRVTKSILPVYQYYGYVYAPYVFEGIE